MKIDYSKKRKELQSINECPEWYTTGGIQLFYERYSNQGESPKSRYKAIAKAMAQHAPKEYPEWWSSDNYTAGLTWEQVFFDTLWDGLISPSTPLLGNGGLRKRGTTVSCAGSAMGNNLFDRYNVITEAAILTKHSHGTSCSIDDWPHEGAPLKRGGHSGGVSPVVRDLINVMDEVVQGHRRGSLAYYIRPQHGDFEWVLKHLYEHPESNNVGWNIDDEFVDMLDRMNPEMLTKFAETLAVKMTRGKGYYGFIDKMNRHLAYAFKRKGMTVKASNLCTETCLPADENYTYSCVILNYNLEHYRKFPEHLVFIGQVMADCNISEYLATMREMTKLDQQAMQKIYRFTDEFRALGSGVLGLHTLFQKERVIVGSLESFYLNDEVFRDIREQADQANQWLASVLGEPEGCKGLGIRNATMLMMPPTKSTAEIMAGASEGIGLDMAMVFTKQSAGGEFFRVNKILLEIMKERGVNVDDNIKKMVSTKGSVQDAELFPWLTDHERAVFRTAFETPMEAHLELCADRQKYIDQAQSINLYFTSNDPEEYISKIHKIAFKDERILSLYYCYSMRGAGNIKRVVECDVCQ
jgi:ribonucleoside-diphosphate reductase alpha chain